MSIKLTNISKLYGNSEVLHNVSFEVRPGEIAAFLGPNGAGKSTCMKIITGWLTDFTGNVTVCGYDIRKDPIGAKRCIGYLPENNPLYPEMYVREYLEYVGQIYRVANLHGLVDEMIERVKLQEVRGKTIGTLSKGFRQRVGLAQALLHNPEVLILDEPSSGLDPNQLSEIHSLIKELGKEKTILFSSHSLQEVTDLCEHAIIINKGAIVADAQMSELTKEESLEDIFKRLTI
ncbi:ATP-binding cassette domain-containing protein [uncultured Bacteroides sp.]|uniref:ABC transporter ATP-binding protein n=1 Tax=uncultured Bacteroides sp. TaxID=162156 RepID=UPI002AA93E3A|nr:ATP-binding cassette domain-containing protein [uncultured Bacteroides sp.]